MTMMNEGAPPPAEAEVKPGEVLGNDPAARNPDGSLKDPGAKPADGEKPELNADGTPKAKPVEKPAAWKEYENDPSKTAEQNAAAKAEHDKTKPAQGAPEKYEFKVPEGGKLDEKAVEAITPIFKELNLTQDQANKLFDFYNGQIKTIGEAAVNAFEATRTGWREAIAKDPTLGDGKDGFKPEVKATIGRAIDALPNAKAFREAMDFTGAGDNPEFVKAFFHMAQQIGEGRPVRPGGPVAPAKGPASTAQALYPNLPSAS